MQGDYILQMDCDVIIGVRDTSFSLLPGLIIQIDNNDKVLTVAFPICHDPEIKYQSYFGFENGGYVPEVRNCLMKKDRLLSILPLDNDIDTDGFLLSWYRSVEKKQKSGYYCSNFHPIAYIHA